MRFEELRIRALPRTRPGVRVPGSLPGQPARPLTASLTVDRADLISAVRSDYLWQFLLTLYFRIFNTRKNSEKIPKKFLKIQEYKRDFLRREKFKRLHFFISGDPDSNQKLDLVFTTFNEFKKFVQAGISFYSFIYLLLFVLYCHYHHIYYSFE